MDSKGPFDVVIVGGGIFGVELSFRLSSLGLSVCLFEAKNDILMGASANNQNRLHQGFHYPRDLETARQSLRGFNTFKERYSPAILGGFPNGYFISDHDSLVTPEDYLGFCQVLGADYETIDTSDFPIQVNGAKIGVLCREVVYDCEILRTLCWNFVNSASVKVELNERVVKLERREDFYALGLGSGRNVTARVVINSSYADTNRLTEQLGHPLSARLYEYTVVPILEIDIPPIGVTIMDGKFMTLLPHGKSGNFLLYHVVNSVICQDISENIRQDWLDQNGSPFGKIDKHQFYSDIMESCYDFIPILRTAKLKGFLHGPRMVLAHQDITDKRPSIITSYEDSYFTVHAGKIDHSIWVAEELSEKVYERLKA